MVANFRAKWKSAGVGGRRWIVVAASGAGLGYAPVASGTVGTLAGVALYPGFDALRGLSTALYLLAFAVLVAAAIRIAGEAERIFAEKDSSRIVIDEVAGYAAATLFVPMSLSTVIAAFFVFRFFDIVKLWPASWFDRRPGGVGVVMDDVVSGLYANLVVRLLFHLSGHPL